MVLWNNSHSLRILLPSNTSYLTGERPVFLLALVHFSHYFRKQGFRRSYLTYIPEKVFGLWQAEVIWRIYLFFISYFLSFWCAHKQAANDSDLEPISYEFFTQAFVLYEEEVAVIAHESVSSSWITKKGLIIPCNTLSASTFWLIGFQSSGDCNTSDNWNASEDECIWCRKPGYFNTQGHRGNGLRYDMIVVLFLVSKNPLTWFFLGQYSAKLLKKPDQCRAVYACSHLFWVDDPDGIKDGERCAAS